MSGAGQSNQCRDLYLELLKRTLPGALLIRSPIRESPIEHVGVADSFEGLPDPEIPGWLWIPTAPGGDARLLND